MSGTVSGAGLWGMCAPCNYSGPIHAQAVQSWTILRQAVLGWTPRAEEAPLRWPAVHQRGCTLGQCPLHRNHGRTPQPPSALVSSPCKPPPSVHLLHLRHPGSNPASANASSVAEDRHPIPWHVISMMHLALSLVSSQLSSFRPQTSQSLHPVQQVGAQFTDVSASSQQRARGIFEQILVASQAKPWAGRESNAQPVGPLFSRSCTCL